MERLDTSRGNPEEVLASWLRKEITAAVHKKRGEVLYHLSRLLDPLGDVSPLMQVVAELLGQMQYSLKKQPEEVEARPSRPSISLDDQAFTDIEEETTETRTTRRLWSARSGTRVQEFAAESSPAREFENIINRPKR